MNYIQLHVENLDPNDQEILIAQLADIGFEGFEQGPDFLNASIAETLYHDDTVVRLFEKKTHHFTTEVIPQQNWNDQWEKSFEPVIIDDFCAIRADFHAPVATVQHEIIITPKMSFGTGHHPTTFQVIKFMEKINFTNKNVLDFGTGTGVLAILAEKLGAKEILAIDNDDWSINNAIENIEKNHFSHINVRKTEGEFPRGNFDIILANINKHVILSNLPFITKHFIKNGVLILSGLLKDDEREIRIAATEEHLRITDLSEKSGWLALYIVNVNSDQNNPQG